MTLAGEVPGPSGPTPATGRRGLAWAFLRTARPKQWSKNVLVFVAPGAAGVLTHSGSGLRALAAFGIFCAAASGTYFVNDTVDAEADRSHPAKARRPIASGQLGRRSAVAVAVALFAVAVAGAWWLASWHLALVVGAYVAVNVGYSVRLKHVPVVELSAVASGFVLRAIAGGIATHVPLSSWFLVVTSFGALFLVVGKRAGEHHTLGDGRGAHRATLDLYSMQFLRSALTLSAAATVTTYCLWAFDRTGLARRGDHLVWIELSVVPVIVGVLYVLRLLDAGQGSAPTEMALSDRTLQVLALAWVALVALGVYA
ncbi:MAG: decaprenyl-phosphate phosphoribosyltransferase [Acidimicrobiales bacterium]